jgi:hypothetical protein
MGAFHHVGALRARNQGDQAPQLGDDFRAPLQFTHADV